jgi:signal transduction histidine kinase
MSHELRTPLNAILGFAQLLDLDDLADEQRDNLGHIMTGARHLLSLINEVLDIAATRPAGTTSCSPARTCPARPMSSATASGSSRSC